MSRVKLAGLGVLAVVVTLGIGYVWGASGRFAINNALDETKQQLDLAEARGQLLDARVSLYNTNFGDAARHFDAARTPLERARARAQDTGDTVAGGNLATALERTAEGQRLAGTLDPAANGKAAEALDAIQKASRD